MKTQYTKICGMELNKAALMKKSPISHAGDSQTIYVLYQEG